MLAETIDGIKIALSQEVLYKALEIYLNEHVFKGPLKVSHISSRTLMRDHKEETFFGFEITCEGLLARLGETVH